jgi:hypothetical protein
LPLAVFGISVGLSFVAWGIFTAQYVWPALRSLPRARALRPLLLLHSFRFVGLSFLVPGLVSPNLPEAFTRPAAYGDLITAVLALLTLAALPTRVGIGLGWIFNLWGSGDLLYAFHQGLIGVGIKPGRLGAAYFIPTAVVPMLMITHGLVFRLLLWGGDRVASQES